MRISVIFITFLFLTLSPLLAQKKPRTGKEPLLGKEYAAYKITSNELSGACFYLVSGHGGPMNRSAVMSPFTIVNSQPPERTAALQLSPSAMSAVTV